MWLVTGERPNLVVHWRPEGEEEEGWRKGGLVHPLLDGEIVWWSDGLSDCTAIFDMEGDDWRPEDPEATALEGLAAGDICTPWNQCDGHRLWTARHGF